MYANVQWCELNITYFTIDLFYIRFGFFISYSSLTSRNRIKIFLTDKQFENILFNSYKHF